MYIPFNLLLIKYIELIDPILGYDAELKITLKDAHTFLQSTKCCGFLETYKCGIKLGLCDKVALLISLTIIARCNMFSE